MARLELAPAVLEQILRGISHNHQELVREQFKQLAFDTLLRVHMFCHNTGMMNLAHQAEARFIASATFVLSEHCGSGNELERDLLDALPLVLKCNSFAKNEATLKSVDKALFHQTKNLLYAYRDRLFWDRDHFSAFLRSCPGLAEDIACDAARDRIPTRRLTCPLCASWVKHLSQPYMEFACASCNSIVVLEPLTNAEGGDGTLCMKLQNRNSTHRALQIFRGYQKPQASQPHVDVPAPHHLQAALQVPNAQGAFQDTHAQNAPGAFQNFNAQGAFHNPHTPSAFQDPRAPGAFQDPHATGAFQHPHASSAFQDPRAPSAFQGHHAQGAFQDPYVEGALQVSYAPWDPQALQAPSGAWVPQPKHLFPDTPQEAFRAHQPNAFEPLTNTVLNTVHAPPPGLQQNDATIDPR